MLPMKNRMRLIGFEIQDLFSASLLLFFAWSIYMGFQCK